MNDSVSGTGESPDYVAPIVRCAAPLFAEQGYRGTSMRDIAKRVGVQAGSLYVHIQSKEQLLEAIVNTIMERSEKDMAEVLASGATPTEQLRDIAARDLALIGENREFATVFFHEWRNLGPEGQERVVASRDRWEAGVREVISQGIASGEFRDIEPRTASIVLSSILNWTYVWYSADGDLTTEQLADRFVDIFVHGIHAGP